MPKYDKLTNFRVTSGDVLVTRIAQNYAFLPKIAQKIFMF